MKNKNQIVTDVIHRIDFVLDESRGLLSKENIQHLKEARALLTELDDAPADKAESIVTQVIINVARIVANPEFLELLQNFLHDHITKH